MPRRYSYRRRPMSKTTAAKVLQSALRRTVTRRRYAASKIPTGVFRKNQTYNLKYADIITMNAGSGLVATHFFRANSIYQPDVSGGGSSHQPMGTDQLFAIYNHALVTHAKIKATFMYSSDADTRPMWCCIRTDSTSADLISSITTAIENNRSNFMHYANAKTGLGPVVATVNNSVNIKKFFNVTDIKDNQSKLAHQITSNPSDEVYFQVACSTYGYDPSACNVLIEIDYTVIMSEPYVQAPS